MAQHTPEDIAYAVSLFSAVRRIMRTKFAKGKKFDPSTWLMIETMKFIADHDKPKMKDVAEYLSITAPSATALIGGLMKRGLVARSVDRRDQRASRLTLTAKGKAELGETIAHGIKLVSGLFTALSKKELAAFTGALERIREKAAYAKPGK